jgi:hypothetical protein
MTVFKSNAEAAVFYASQGWPVFPCHAMSKDMCSCTRECRSPGKHPIPPNGHLWATADVDKIRQCWIDLPDANIGFATGGESKVWVLDLDGEEGIKAFEELEAKHGSVAKGPCVKTGGGGRHLFFRMPDGLDIGNPVGVQGKKIDVRATGAYVIVPPSNHKSGNSYEWDRSLNDFPILEAPAWLIDFVMSANAPASGDGPDRQFQDIAGVLNLETDPGAPDGKRHATATRLIGHHLGVGEDPLTVYLKAMAWAMKCQPPLEEEEIRKMVQHFYKNDMAKLTDEPANEAPWPTLAPAALHGLAGEIVRAIEPHTEADKVALLAQLMVVFGCVVGRSAHFLVEATRHHCNLFTAIVGATAIGRKGTSVDRIRELFQTIDADWLRSGVKGGLTSGEGLIWNVRDPMMKKEPIRKDPSKKDSAVVGHRDVIDDHGISDKRLLVIEPEFASVLRTSKRDSNTLSPVIRQAWDSGNLQTLAKNSPAKATDAHIAMTVHITQEELLRCMAEADYYSGFANRYLWISVKRSQFLPEGGGTLDLTPFIDRLREAVEFAKSVGRMTRDTAASEMWAKVYKQLGQRRMDGMLKAVTNRAEAQVLRASMIYALLDMKAVIEPKHLEAALALWQYAEDSARYVFGNSTGDSLADRLLAIIREKPVTKKEIHNLTSNNIQAAKLDAALKNLERLKLIRRERDTRTGGAPATRYQPAE